MVLFFLFPILSGSQNTLKGIVRSANNLKPISNCSILVKNENNIILTYTITNSEGLYTVELPKGQTTFIIETSILIHNKIIKNIKIDSEAKSTTYNLDFELEPRIRNLEEVYVVSKKPLITIKNDTTQYDLKRFKDGSERVVEDVLKKLPGITVSNNGLIKFKGKQVTRVLLDGDNIFNNNYNIGTKNIDSEIVESIQAIEDYSPNHLLKGIKTSNDVAVNLILKKGKSDISGNNELGIGIKNKKILNANIISVSKKLKGFSTINYNNISENPSPYSFSSNSYNLLNTGESLQKTTNLVDNGISNSVLPDNRTLVNNTFFGSVNALYKFNNKLSLRTNYSYFTDKIIRNEATTSNNIINDSSLVIRTQNNLIKKPKVNSYDYEIIYKINRKSLLTSEGKLNIQKSLNESNGFNNESLYKSLAKSRDLFLKNNLEYTYKFNKNNVFQIISNLSTNNLPQNIDVLLDSESLIQDISFKKNFIDVESKLISKSKKSKYSFVIGYNFDENIISSNLEGIALNNQFNTNDIFYTLSKFYLNLSYNYRINRWLFSANLTNELINAKLNDVNLANNYNRNHLLFNPKLSINYYLNSKSYLYSNYNEKNDTPNASQVYSGLILTNNRTLLNNVFNFNIFNSKSIKSGFKINDFYNLFQFEIYAKYNFRKYGYINRLNINKNRTFFTSVVDVTNNKNLSFSLETEKYIHFLKSTININSFYSINEYQNIINNSNLRDNKNKMFSNALEIRTGFKGSVNFTNKSLLNTNRFETSSENSNSFTTFQNDFSIKYLNNNFQIILDTQYFNPNLKSNISGDLFLDTSIIYNSKKGKTEYKLKINNLFNKKTFRNINTSDFSTSTFQQNLVERFFVLSVNFKFL